MNRAEIMAHAARFMAHRREQESKPPRYPVYFFNGEMLTAAEIAKRTGLSSTTIMRRARAGAPLHHPDKRFMDDEERIRRGLGLGPRFPETEG